MQGFSSVRKLRNASTENCWVQEQAHERLKNVNTEETYGIETFSIVSYKTITSALHGKVALALRRDSGSSKPVN